METVIIKACVFYFIILVGYVFKRTQFLDDHALKLLSKLMLKVTSPGLIIMSLANIKIELQQLLLIGLGIVFPIIYLLVALFQYRNTSAQQRAEAVISYSGYNIGAFGLPFIQNFFSGSAVLATALFDIGNSFIVLGGSLAVAQSQLHTKNRFRFSTLLKMVFSQVAILTYLVMILLGLLHIPTPEFVLELAKPFGQATTMVAMLMLGLAIDIRLDKHFLNRMVKILLSRYCVSAILASIVYFILPLSIDLKQILVLLVFTPIPIVSTAFIHSIKGDTELSGAVSSLSILISIPIMSALLVMMGHIA
ncbi:hypothetical protein KG090_04990 [Carnobacteriaceae bacterium zg-ZUI240]|nr:hypothetical protein [Carnobacteriaceae bacterium zg-ZUI240]